MNFINKELKNCVKFILFIIIINKMIYIGYLVRFETAKSLFPWAKNYSDTEFEKSINNHNHLKIDGIDKGQCVLGIPIKALSDLWDVFVHVDDGIQMILETKKLLYKVLRDLEADLSDFELEQMEGDSIRVFNPEPYLISI